MRCVLSITPKKGERTANVQVVVKCSEQELAGAKQREEFEVLKTKLAAKLKPFAAIIRREENSWEEAVGREAVVTKNDTGMTRSLSNRFKMMEKECRDSREFVRNAVLQQLIREKVKYETSSTQTDRSTKDDQVADVEEGVKEAKKKTEELTSMLKTMCQSMDKEKKEVAVETSKSLITEKEEPPKKRPRLFDLPKEIEKDATATRFIDIGGERVEIPADIVVCPLDYDVIKAQELELNVIRHKWDTTPTKEKQSIIRQAEVHSAQKRQAAAAEGEGQLFEDTRDTLHDTLSVEWAKQAELRLKGQTFYERAAEVEISQFNLFDLSIPGITDYKVPGFNELKRRLLADVDFNSLVKFQRQIADNFTIWPYQHVLEQPVDKVIVVEGLTLMELFVVVLEELTYGSLHAEWLKGAIINWKNGLGIQPLTSIDNRLLEISTVMSGRCLKCKRLAIHDLLHMPNMELPEKERYDGLRCAGPFKRLLIGCGIRGVEAERSDLVTAVVLRMQQLARVSDNLLVTRLSTEFINFGFLIYGGLVSFN